MRKEARTGRRGWTLAIAAALTAAVASVGLGAQKITPADAAARLSGVWKVNRDLTTSFASAAPRRGGASYAVAMGVQRRGPGGRGPTSMSPADLAGMAAMRSLQQIAETVTIAATADSVTFTDPRGVRTYAITGKNVKVDMQGATVLTKAKWDKATLHQEFLYGDTKVTYFWDLNDAGNQLTLKIRTEDFSRAGSPFKEAKAVYDKN
jgi:hypothetical protein